MQTLIWSSSLEKIKITKTARKAVNDRQKGNEKRLFAFNIQQAKIQLLGEPAIQPAIQKKCVIKTVFFFSSTGEKKTINNHTAKAEKSG